MYQMSKKDLSSGELETLKISRSPLHSPMTVVTANGWGAWPFLDLALGVKVVLASEWVGPRLSGSEFGPSFSRWGCWPFLLVMVSWHFFLGVVFFFFSGGWPFLLALPSCCQWSPFLLGMGEVGPSR